MENFLKNIKEKAKSNPKRIIFAEGNEPRIIEAAKIIKEEGIAIPILLTNHLENPKFDELTEELSKLRNISIEAAKTKLEDPHYFATMMLHVGEADGMIAGPSAPSTQRIVPALEIIKTKEKFHKASGFVFMILPPDTDEDAANGGLLLFADCALIIEPSAQELADIAIDTAETAKRFGLEPKVAMLSFSSGTSNHPEVKTIREAAEMARSKRPEIQISDDMQVDAALIDDIGQRKVPGSKIAGHANVLIFPNLEAGNIGYKLVERLAGAKAIGPIIQGLNKPVNELSRGSKVEDIVNLAAITTIEAQDENFTKQIS